MNVGVIGLGKMGNAIAYRLVQAGHTVYGFDPYDEAKLEAEKAGVMVASTVSDVAKEARVIWLLVPAGEPVDNVIAELLPHLHPGDIIVDGGNSKYTDSIRRATQLKTNDIIFLDCGTSGGVHGRTNGFCLMFGGDKAAYASLASLCEAVAAPNGVGHVGPSGAGHYVKMIHNGIEYGLLQAYAEGFQIIHEGTFEEQALDLQEVTRIWCNGSVIRSFLLDLAHGVFTQDQALTNINGEIKEGGTGKWTLEEARTNNIPVPVLDASLRVRSWSRDTGGNYATKVVQMLRHAFGGHPIKKIK
jgi:6-phosphogluconate dehydrogenase